MIFERLMRDPVAAMADVYKFIDVAPHQIDPGHLAVRTHGSDSHCRHKYPHRQYASIEAPPQHAIPARIQSEIEKNYAWYYDNFYPDWKRSAAPAQRWRSPVAPCRGVRQSGGEAGCQFRRRSGLFRQA